MPHPCLSSRPQVLYIDGKLALIDYGQVKRLTEKERLSVAKAFMLVEAAIKIDPKTDPKVGRQPKQPGPKQPGQAMSAASPQSSPLQFLVS